MMKFTRKHIGKWVVSKNEKILAYDKSFKKLRLKFRNRKDQDTLLYTPVPQGPMA